MNIISIKPNAYNEYRIKKGPFNKYLANDTLKVMLLYLARNTTNRVLQAFF